MTRELTKRQYTTFTPNKLRKPLQKELKWQRRQLKKSTGTTNETTTREKQHRVHRRRGRRRSRYRSNKIRPPRSPLSFFFRADPRVVRRREHLHERTSQSSSGSSTHRRSRGVGAHNFLWTQRRRPRRANTRYLRPRRPAPFNRCFLTDLHPGPGHTLDREGVFGEQRCTQSIQNG